MAVANGKQCALDRDGQQQFGPFGQLFHIEIAAVFPRWQRP
jgi:hypothetical protein